MRVMCKLSRGIGILLGVSAAALVLGLQGPAARAETASGAAAVGGAQSSAFHQAAGTFQVASARAMTSRRSGRYFIEFRARSAASYGHMYVLYGRVNGRQQIIKSEIAGLHPAGDAADCYNCSVVPWTLGHLIPVPAETGPSDGDLEEKYVTARYRVWLNAAEYKDVAAYIEKLKADSPLWNALWANCVSFGRNVAEHMGLQVPVFIWLEPKNFVDQLREINGGPKQEQAPLKDAANSLKGTIGFRTALPKQVGLPPSRPTAAPVAAKHPDSAQPAVLPVAAAEPAAKPAAMKTMVEEKAEAKPATKPKAEMKSKAEMEPETKKPATAGMATNSATR